MALGETAYRVGVQAARIPKSSPRPGFVPGRDVEAEGIPEVSHPSPPQPILFKLRVQSGRVLRSKYIFPQGAVLPRANQSREQREKVVTKMVHLNPSYASRTAVPRPRQAGIWTGEPQGTQRRCPEEQPSSCLPSIQHQVCRSPVPLSGFRLPFIPDVPFQSKASPKASPLRDIFPVFGAHF